MVLGELCQIAEAAARKAGELLKNSNDLRKVNVLEEKDIKLQADVEAETLIRNEFKMACPDIPIIGEEFSGNADLLQADEYYWIVDPLDGTYNYFRHFPLCCVSIGLWRGEEPVLGVIYDFSRDEMLSGFVGEGIFLNGKKLEPTWAEKAEDAVLMTGFSPTFDYSDANILAFAKSVQSFRKVRMLGSSTLHFATVVRGQADCCFEPSIRLWDIAAGLALLKAAGGHFTLKCLDPKNFVYTTTASGSQQLLSFFN